MANLRKWSTTATGNASVAGGANTINFSEGQTPGSVNNSAREMMAQVRSIYTPDEWGWVEHSATVSVASQTVFKLAGNQTANWTAGRRWRLKSGSTTRYGAVVSSSFTSETTITVTVDSGSLSASHSLAALAAITSNHVPATVNTYVTSDSLSAALATYVTSNSLSAALATYVTSNSMSAAIANFVTSASASTMIATQIAAAPAGALTLIEYKTLTTTINNYIFSGSWTAYSSFELLYVINGTSAAPQTLSFAAFTDGGTTAILTAHVSSIGPINTTPVFGSVKFFGTSGEPAKAVLPVAASTSGVSQAGTTSTANTGIVNAIRIATSASFSSGYAALYGYRKA